ncbi:MAG: MFS transporter [Candidatus Dojkabacteria bacterium]
MIYSNIFNLIKGRGNVNKVVIFLIYSDFFIQMGWGLINPIIAVFITDQIQGGDLTVVGIAASIVLISQAIVQFPVAKWVDSKKGELDDFRIMVLGNILIALSTLLFLFANSPLDIYIIQLFYGLGCGLVFPGYVAIFTRHIDKNREGFEWTLYSTFINLGTAFSATVGGVLAEKYGFHYIFVIAFVLSILGIIFSLGIHANLRKK